MVEAASIAPELGALGYVDLGETAGHEQTRRRPVLVISKRLVNARTGMMLGLPITSRIKGYAQEIILPEGLPVAGAVLLAQARSFDFRARNFQILGYAPEDFTDDVIASFIAMLQRE